MYLKQKLTRCRKKAKEHSKIRNQCAQRPEARGQLLQEALVRQKAGDPEQPGCGFGNGNINSERQGQGQYCGLYENGK